MTWTNPSNVSTGNNLTATLWNNLLGVAGSLKFLHNRSTYTVLANGLRTGTNQSIANNTDTTVTFTSGTNSNYATVVTGTGVFTIQESGVYLLEAYFSYASNATGNRFISFEINNGIAQSIAFVATSVNVDGFARMKTTLLRSLVANDTVEFVAKQNSGGALNIVEASCSIAKFG